MPLAHRARGWDDLSAVEQTILMVAAQERTLEHACASWSEHPGRTSDIELTRGTAMTLYKNGLIGFYRVDDGYPDLSTKDLATVFNTRSYWDAGHSNSSRVGVFLTTSGEDTVLGP